MSQPPITNPEVVRYSDRPELWDSLEHLSSEVWPEYNLHGDVLNRYWDQLYTAFPEWQFVLFDTAAGQVLAEGHAIPVDWDGTDPGLGPGIDASLAAGFALQAAGGTPSAVCALAAEIPPRHQGRGLSPVMLRAMAGLAADAGLAHLIALVRPNLKERYPTIAIGRYAAWTREDGTPFDPTKPLQMQTRKNAGGDWQRSSPRSGTLWATPESPGRQGSARRVERNEPLPSGGVGSRTLPARPRRWPPF